ncbi:MAG: HNH endonuclease signature motif containing protein [Patescibacteria group bacterium]
MKSKSWTENDLKRAVRNSKSIRQTIFCLGLIPAGGNYLQIQKFLKLYRIGTSHFTGRGWSKGLKGIGKPRIELKNILVRNSFFQSFKLKKRLFAAKLKSQSCEECGWNKMSEDGRMPLELDHINGNSTDNRLENLRVLCPNCHSLKPTHRGRNRKRK